MLTRAMIIICSPLQNIHVEAPTWQPSWKEFWKKLKLQCLLSWLHSHTSIESDRIYKSPAPQISPLKEYSSEHLSLQPKYVWISRFSSEISMIANPRISSTVPQRFEYEKHTLGVLYASIRKRRCKPHRKRDSRGPGLGAEAHRGRPTCPLRYSHPRRISRGTGSSTFSSIRVQVQFYRETRLSSPHPWIDNILHCDTLSLSLSSTPQKAFACSFTSSCSFKLHLTLAGIAIAFTFRKLFRLVHWNGLESRVW